MSRKTPDERALPSTGHIPRNKAWAIVLENDGLVKYCARKYALELTGYGRASFAGLSSADLFDELIGSAYEGALISAENLDPHKKNFNLPAYLRNGIFRYMKREAEGLLGQRGSDTIGLDAFTTHDQRGGESLEEGHLIHLVGIRSKSERRPTEYPLIDQGLVPSSEEEFFTHQEQEENEATVKAYVEQLLMANLTDSERRLANVIIKGDKAERIPFFSTTFASLRDKLIKRAAWMQAEGFGVPDGWGDTIRHRIEKRAREWAEAQ